MQGVHICLLFAVVFVAATAVVYDRNKKERERKSRKRLKRYQVKFYLKGDIDEYIEPELRVYYDTFIRAHSIDELKLLFKQKFGKIAIITKITKISESGDVCEW